MKPILKYQFDQLMKQFLLLQEHAVSRTCPYTVGGDYCIRKHLMTIEAYCEETLPMNGDEEIQELLGAIQSEARNLRTEEEATLCGEDAGHTEDLCGWARRRRKDIEPLTLVCELEAETEEAMPAILQPYEMAEEELLETEEEPNGSEAEMQPVAIRQGALRGG